MHLTVLDVESTLCILSVDRKCEVSKLNVGVVLIIAIREISNHENEFDVNSRNIRPSKITRYTVIGRAKRAPHWGVQSRFRVIYVGMYVCLSWSKKRRRKYVGQTRACSKSVLCGKIRPVTPVLLISTIRYSSFSMDGRETFTYK